MSAANPLNKKRKIKSVLGKSEAREQFLPLIDLVASGAGPVEITDYGKVVAVLLSKKDYEWLSAAMQHKPKPKRSLAGSALLLGDLEEASKQIAAEFEASFERSAREL